MENYKETLKSDGAEGGWEMIQDQENKLKIAIGTELDRKS